MLISSYVEAITNDIDIFILDIDCNNIYIDKSIIPIEQIKDIEKYEVKNDRDKRFISRIFLFQYCKIFFGLTDYTFDYINKARPVFKSSSIKFNFSYSKNKIVIAISKKSNIGVDIEYIDTNIDTETLSIFFMNSEESNFLKKIEPNMQYDYFFTTWTYKEARVKLSGEGMYSDLKNVTIQDETNIKKRHIYLKLDKYICTVCYI